MKRRRWTVLAACLATAISTRCLARGSTVEDIPLDSWVYDAVFELSSQVGPGNFLLHTRPFTRGEVAEWVRGLSGRADSLTTGSYILLRRLEAEFAEELAETGEAASGPSAARAYEDHVRLSGGPTARVDQFRHGYVKKRIGADLIGSFSSGQTVAARVRVRLDSDGRSDPQFRGEYWKKKFTAWVDQAVLTAQYRRFHAAFGREFWTWGRSPNDALLISAHSPPFDGVRLGYRGSNWTFMFCAAVLDSMRVDSADYLHDVGPVGTASRYLVAHRLDWRPIHNLEIAVSEVMVFGGIRRPWALNYLNPLLPYYWEQLNSNTNDNPLWNLEFSWRPWANYEVYGEWLIDDFQIDFVSEPQEIGIIGGLAMSPGPFDGRLFVSVEYERINTYVYGQDRPWNRYYHFRDLNGNEIGIGSELGTDVDRIAVKPRWHASSGLDLTGLIQLIRRGENHISDPRESGVPQVKFPSGTVEREFALGAGVHVQDGGHLVANLEGGYQKTTNVAHQPGVERDGLFLRFRLAGLLWKTMGI